MGHFKFLSERRQVIQERCGRYAIKFTYVTICLVRQLFFSSEAYLMHRTHSCSTNLMTNYLPCDKVSKWRTQHDGKSNFNKWHVGSLVLV